MHSDHDNTISIGPFDAAVEAFYGGCKPAAAAYARLSRQASVSFAQPASGNPRAVTPSTYVVCTEDRVIHPNHQRIMSSRCQRTVEVAAGHSPFMSMPRSKPLRSWRKSASQPLSS